MAASLVTALGMVSSAMGQRVAEEVKKYGANLVIVPAAAAIEVGSGALDFGPLAEPAYLSRESILGAVGSEGIDACSFHLRGHLNLAGRDVPAEGVDFGTIRALYPWWQLQGEWPAAGEGVIGTDLAVRLKVGKGSMIRAAGSSGEEMFRISGVVATGGEEDKLLFLPLETMQQLLGTGPVVSQARLLARTGEVPLAQQAARLQRLLPGSQVREVRQVARTSEGLLRKVQLLMALVTGVVVIASASSVASTMSMTVLERGKEIGLLKAMGGSRREVLFIFSGEAVLLGILGGVIGFLCGSLIAAFVMRTVFAVSSGFSPAYAGTALLVSLLIALTGGSGAMMAVFRLDPVRSLRGE
jgi:putative ABC transport system permease protein